MAAAAIHQFAECITCHAWSPDQSSKTNALPLLLPLLRSRSRSPRPARRFRSPVAPRLAYLTLARAGCSGSGSLGFRFGSVRPSRVASSWIKCSLAMTGALGGCSAGHLDAAGLCRIAAGDRSSCPGSHHCPVLAFSPLLGLRCRLACHTSQGRLGCFMLG